jgi:homoserine O-acetyltransferase
LQWLKALDIQAVDVVVGYSYGGYQAFQWALTPPVPVGRVVALASAPRGNGSLADAQKAFDLARRFQEADMALHEWQQVRVNTLTAYGYADWLQAQGCADIPAELAVKAHAWAQQFSPWSMAYLRQASAVFNVEDALKVRHGGAPLLWMVNSGDRLFPATFSAADVQPEHEARCASPAAPKPVTCLPAQQVDGDPPARHIVHERQNLHCVTLNGRFGHGSPLLEAELWIPVVQEFLAR